MSHQFNDELISAYLDGELTAEEQALVEQKLNKSPKHQQMFAELSALRESFQALPNYKLDERFGERVLRAAERNMLVHSPASHSGPSNSSSGIELPSPASLTTDSRRGWRMAVGSVAAVAALVLVTFFLANRGGEVRNDPAVSQHEEENARDKTDKHGDEPGQEDSVVIESLAERDGRKRESGSPIDVDESVKNKSLADRNSVPLDAQTEKHLQAGASLKNGAGEPLNRPFTASPRRSGSATEPAGREGGFGGSKGNSRAALGGLDSVARDVSKSPAADFADGAGPIPEAGLSSSSLDGVVIIEIARDQRQQRPVELALNRIQVRELQPASALALRQSLADQTATIEPRSNKVPEELKIKEIQAEGGKALDSSDELLVVATASEITEVCEMLRKQGLNARFDGNEIAAAAVAPLILGRKSPAKFARQVEGPNLDGKLAEAKKRKQDDDRNLPVPLPSREKADADKFAGTAVSPKPAPAAPAGPPKANKDEEKAQEKLPSPTDSGALAGQDQVRMKNLQISRALIESYRKEVSGSFFYRLFSGPEQRAERKQDARQVDEADPGAAAPQRLAKGTASRGVRTAPEDATAESAGDDSSQTASPLRRLQVRFVIRTIESPASGSASEEPASKK